LRIDFDLYSSTKTIFNELNDRIQAGTIMVFDEYFNYPGWKKGEYLALKEFCQKYNFNYKCISYCEYGQQVAIRIL